MKPCYSKEASEQMLEELRLSEHLLSEGAHLLPSPPHPPILLARFYGEPFVPFPWVDLRFLPFLMVTPNLVLLVELGHIW